MCQCSHHGEQDGGVNISECWQLLPGETENSSGTRGISRESWGLNPDPKGFETCRCLLPGAEGPKGCSGAEQIMSLFPTCSVPPQSLDFRENSQHPGSGQLYYPRGVSGTFPAAGLFLIKLFALPSVYFVFCVCLKLKPTKTNRFLLQFHECCPCWRELH